MGGYGSTRWNWQRKTTTVEDSRPLPIRAALRSGGVIAWQLDGYETDRLAFALHHNADGVPTAVTLQYTISRDIHDPRIATADESGLEPTAVGVVPAIRPQPEVLPQAIITPRHGEHEAIHYDIAIVTRTTAAGIVQRLWRCPLLSGCVPCGHTVRTLYLPPGARYFGCRQCHRLAYRSAQTHDKNAGRRLQLLLAQADRLTHDTYHHD